MFKERLISGIIVLAIAIAAMLLGGWVLFSFVEIITFIGLFEMYRAIGIEKELPALAGFAATAVYALLLSANVNDGAVMGIAIAVLAIMAVYVFTFPKYNAAEIFGAIGGFVYVTVLMSFIYKVRIMPSGLYIIPMVFICAWGNDTCAYCVGVLFGKHKMSPKLSPKKSIEGFFGGLLGAAILGAIYGLIFGKGLVNLPKPALNCALIGLGGAFTAVIGDLAASAIKRDQEIKDYSKLIPGHGGILDRFDSILFTAPIVYILTVLLGH